MTEPAVDKGTDERALAMELEHELREERPVTLGALLGATALLRVGVVGTGVALQFRLIDLAGGRPSLVAIGLVGAAQAVSEMFFAPVMARYADRWGRTRFLVGGPLIGAVAVLLCAFAGGAGQLGGARLLEGVGAAAFIPTALGMIAAATMRDSTARARASGAFEGSTLAGYAGGFAFGAFMYSAFHASAFIALACLYVLAAVVCLTLVPRVPPLPVSPLRTVLRAVLGPGPIRVFLPGWLASFALLGAFVANLPALLRRQALPGQTLVHHFGPRVIGLILVSWIVLFLIGILLWTPWLPRLGAPSTMRRAVPGAWLVLLALLAINHTHFGFAPAFIPFLVIGILWLAGFGPAAVTYLADCSETLVADRSALMSFYTVTLAGGGALGAVIGGIATRYLYADGLILLGFVLSTITFVMLGAVMRYERTARRQAGPAEASSIALI